MTALLGSALQTAETRAQNAAHAACRLALNRCDARSPGLDGYRRGPYGFKRWLIAAPPPRRSIDGEPVATQHHERDRKYPILKRKLAAAPGIFQPGLGSAPAGARRNAAAAAAFTRGIGKLYEPRGLGPRR
jgi:hypothetical protein